MRSIPDPGFAGDDGAASAQLVQALADYDARPDELHAATLAVLQRTRLLVPVVAVPGEVGYDDQGLAHDKTSDMATVLIEGRDGRRALLAFTSTQAMRRWDPAARPVPVSVSTTAQSALQDGASAVVLDVAGPVLFVLETEDLEQLAAGHVLVQVSDRFGWVTPDR